MLSSHSRAVAALPSSLKAALSAGRNRWLSSIPTSFFTSSLPFLPLPTLRHTLDKYTASLAPLLRADDFSAACARTDESISGGGAQPAAQVGARVGVVVADGGQRALQRRLGSGAQRAQVGLVAVPPALAGGQRGRTRPRRR